MSRSIVVSVDWLVVLDYETKERNVIRFVLFPDIGLGYNHMVPLTLSTIPPLMDAPWNYDESGSPKDTELMQKSVDQKDYIAAVRQEEDRSDGNSRCLSEALEHSRKR
ncbi:uncharacterized protein LY89DRAFT_723625 [Mollisia scopiformis]|uniref:Uncharacterized protein n=1 Tax=Mollisia scopiformis TaxID=149040 RepID=A0A132BDD8_MOLSC|nr:uncharacterized protein LY89DRAFT_723625 [Mollisia scopiformis]KUJ10398.1 hypothetical protein LY89DRAFT_723625 [Mollisia scopiformis]